MEQEQVVAVETEKSFPFFKILLKNALLIILTTILCALIGLGYCVMKVPPTYTASCSLILRTEIGSSSSQSQTANQATLAKRYLPTVEKLIKSPGLLLEADDNYAKKYEGEEQSLSKGAISVNYGEKSLIFSITYTDLSRELAEKKLNVLIDTFSTSKIVSSGIMADNVKFIRTQKDVDVVSNTSYVKYTIIGAVAGVVISVIATLIVYALDNTVRDKKEFEELTGVSVVAYINKERTKKK